MDEKTIQRIKKLQALAERGVGGEKTTAQKKLAKLLKDNGINSLDELQKEEYEYTIFSYNGKHEIKLLRQCMYKVMGAKSDRTAYKPYGRRQKIGIYCTKAQKIEIELEFEFYRNVFYEELSTFMDAFIQAQKIFPEDAPVGDYDEFNERDMKIAFMATGIERRSRAAMIEEKDSAGYGLAQWTYWSRKQALLNHAKQAGASVADLNMQLGFLWEELQGYTAVMDALKKAGSVRAASDAVLTGYEKPADQSETVKKKRAEYGEGYYKKYAAGNGTKYYRVRKSWTDAASQLGAFTSLENAKSACKAGYTVYDDNGKAVYTAAGQQASAGVPFSVQVDILDLNIRTGAGTNYAKTGKTTGKGVFTIVEVKAGQGASVGWGRLKSGAGWISLDYATRLA